MSSKDTNFYGQIAVSTLSNGVSAAYTFKNSVDRMDTAVTAVKVEVKDKQGLVASWGKNNDYPQKVLEAVKLNGSASSGIRFMRKAHYGNGIIFVKDEVENGKKAPKVIPLFDLPDQFAFFQKSQMSRFHKEVITDLEYFSIAFPEYILSENGQTINRVKRQQAAWCRFELMNEENGLVEHVYISEKFGKGGSVDLVGGYVEKVALIDSYWSVEEVKAYCIENGIKKFIRPIFYPLIDEAYYPESEWHSVIKSGWMEVANSVPALKKAVFNNQMTIKYIIEIDERYFEKVYAENWQKMKVEERIDIRKKLIDDINSSLVGNDKAGKSIQSMKLYGQDGKPYPAVEIKTVDDKFKDGSYLPEAEAANSEILVAIGVDASLIGGAGIPGGKMGAGSGSDKRVAFDVLNALLKTNRETALEPYDFIAQFNGWDTSIRASFETIKIETLDKNPTGKTNTTA
jgi:hypothetical protein